MTVGLSVVARDADGSLAGCPDASGPVVALGDPPGPAAVRWLDREPAPSDPGGDRLIAPAGEGLWRRAPWPAAEPLFELPRAPDGGVLVTGAQTDLRDTIVARARDRGVAAELADPLDAGQLRDAACVVIAESPGGALPARAHAVLAAARLLLVPRLERSFGLEDGLDHLEFAGPDEAVTLLESFMRNRDLYEPILVWARLKAEAQRASVVYGRLAEGLRRDGVA